MVSHILLLYGGYQVPQLLQGLIRVAQLVPQSNQVVPVKTVAQARYRLVREPHKVSHHHITMHQVMLQSD